MKVTSNDKFTTLTAEKDFDYFLDSFANTYNSLATQNMVLDLSEITATETQIHQLKTYAETQTNNQHSFVIVLPVFDADAFEDELTVVPTLTEAEDMIDMDEMTRDLGF